MGDAGGRHAGEPGHCGAIWPRGSLPLTHWRRFALLPALVVLLVAHGTAVARAVDGLPPGVPIPSWAKGKKVHFDPAEPQSPRLAGGGAAASSAKITPLTSSPPRLQYWGGLVQNEPRLVLVFLGEEWESGSALARRHELEATAESLPGSGYQKILTQYGGLDGPISSPLTGSPIIEKYYLKRAITSKIGHVAVTSAAREVMMLTGGESTNTTYAVLPAPGTAEVSLFTCGYHEETSDGGDSWVPGPSIAAVMDTEGRIGCNSSKTLTHEYAESVTDPGGEGGWSTGESQGEIGDLCNQMGPGRLADGALVALLWDDSKGACEVEDDNPGFVPIGPYAETSNRNPSLEGATNETVESEALETSIYPCDLEAHYYFEYGATTAYGSRTAESVTPAAWGKDKVATTITGLQHSTPYHWRVVVTTSNGTAHGVDHEFTIPYNVEIAEEGVSNVGLSEATLNGEVRPVGVEAKYYFEYGATEAYGSKTAETSAGSGKAFVNVSAVLTGLEPGTLYHFRLVASSSRGTTTGNDERFETYGGKPVVETASAIFVHYTEATLEADVNPKGVATGFYFEYGTTTAYGLRTAEQSAGEGAGAEEESEHISGLAPGTTYHFRIVATNSYGTSFGADWTFSTKPEPVVEIAKPSVQTNAPASFDSTDATLSGTINPRGTDVADYFEYGLTSGYGKSTAQGNAGSGEGDVEVRQAIVELSPDTTYHYRLVSVQGSVKQYGGDVTFTTAPAAPLVEPVGPTSPFTPPLPPGKAVDPAPVQTPGGPPPAGPSLQGELRGNSLLVLLTLDAGAARVEMEATVPEVQLGAARRKGRRVSAVLARLVRNNVEMGTSKLVLALDARVRQALRHGRRLTVTLTATVTSAGGEQQKVSRRLVLGVH